MDSFQSLIINKVPRLFETDSLYFDINKSISSPENKKILYQFSGDQINLKSPNVVYFDNYIHFQFIEPFIKKVNRNSDKEFSSLRRSFTILLNKISSNKTNEKKNNTDYSLKLINEYQDDLVKLEGKLSKEGFGNICALIDERWRPKTPLDEFKKGFYNLCNEVSLINTDYHSITNMDLNHVNSESDMIEIEWLIKNGPYYIEKNGFTMQSDKLSINILIECLFNWGVKEEIDRSYLRSITLLIQYIQNERFIEYQIKDDNPNKNFLIFLANENFDVMSDFSKRIFTRVMQKNIIKFGGNNKYISYVIDNPKTLIDFYNLFCHTQARLIDINSDFKTLVTVLREVTTETNVESDIIFPHISDILNNVIIYKKMQTFDLNKEIRAKFQEARYMSDFRQVIKVNVISKWKL